MAIVKTQHFTLTVFSVPDFSLVLPLTSGTAYAGQTIAIGATVESIDQFSGEVVFSVSGYPSGSVVTYFPTNTVTIAPGTPRSIQVNIAIPADNALVGTYDIAITAESTVYNGQ